MYKVLALISIFLFLKIFIFKSLQVDMNKIGIEYAILKPDFSLLDGSHKVKDLFIEAVKSQSIMSFFEFNREFSIENQTYIFKGYVENKICFVRMEKNNELYFINQVPVGIQSNKNNNSNILFIPQLERKHTVLGDLYYKDKKFFKKLSNRHFQVLLPFLQEKELEEIEKTSSFYDSMKKSLEMICVINRIGEIIFISPKLVLLADRNVKHFSTLIFQLKSKLLFDESLLLLEENTNKEDIISDWEGKKFKLKFYNIDNNFYLVLEDLNLLSGIINEKNNSDYIKHQVLSRIDNPVIIGKEKVEFSNYSLILKGEEFSEAEKKLRNSFEITQFTMINGKNILLGNSIFGKYFREIHRKLEDLIFAIRKNVPQNHLQFLVFDAINDISLFILEKNNSENTRINLLREFQTRMEYFCKFASLKNIIVNISHHSNVFCSINIARVFINFLLIECFWFQFKQKEIYIIPGKKSTLCLSIKKISQKEKMTLLSQFEKFSRVRAIYFSEKDDDVVIGLEFENFN